MNKHLNALPGPDDITRRELSNGIVVLVRENHNAQSVVITGALNAGSLFDPPDSVGLASFVASALMRGTKNRDFATIHELLEGNGASLVTSGGMHTIGFSGKSLGEDLPLLIDLLADVLRQPAFPDAQVERLRGEIITSLKIREQDTRYMAARTFRALAYPPDHPYSRQISGTVDTVARITRDQLVDFHREHVGPRGMLVIIVGAVDTDEAIALVEDKLGGWQNPAQPDPPALPELAPTDDVRRQTVIMPGKSQSDIVLGVPGPSRFAEDWQAASLANNILGLFGMFGRIGTEVREKRGLAYYSYSRLNGGLGPSPWQVIAGVDPASIEQAVSTILDEIRRITTELVGEQELADNKANITGRVPLQLETNEGVAGTILAMERYQLGLDYLHRYAGLVNAVTAEDILAAAQRYLSADAYTLAVAGPDLSAAT
ncbi:MAG: insulinase family protein [Anaerolineae bacterium]|nr:insulinase family protein [Anaerolineae bacterium]